MGEGKTPSSLCLPHKAHYQLMQFLGVKALSAEGPGKLFLLENKAAVIGLGEYEDKTVCQKTALRQRAKEKSILEKISRYRKMFCE